jgi:hypothetical protein
MNPAKREQTIRLRLRLRVINEMIWNNQPHHRLEQIHSDTHNGLPCIPSSVSDNFPFPNKFRSAQRRPNIDSSPPYNHSGKHKCD